MWHGTGVPDRTGRRGKPQLGFLAGYTRRKRRVRALVLFVASSVAALALAALYHRDVVTVAAGILAGLAGLYMAWVSVPDTEAAVPDPRKLADDLAASRNEAVRGRSSGIWTVQL
jgi:hypothetical protein